MTARPQKKINGGTYSDLLWKIPSLAEPRDKEGEREGEGEAEAALHTPRVSYHTQVRRRERGGEPLGC